MAPLFSRDVFSYAAQGEMMSHHINPYYYGPGTIGSGPYVTGVDGLWLNTPAPYGPFFLMLAGSAASLSGHNALVTVLLLRLMSVAGVALIAYCIPKLARAYGRDPGAAFTLALLNPLTLLALIGGAHNDAIMVGLLVAGITAAKYRHPVVGIVLCTLAAAIKVPAAIGIVYVAWDWAGTGVAWRQRVRPLLKGGAISVAVMAFLSDGVGAGLGVDRQPGHARRRPLVDGPGHRRRPGLQRGPPRAPHRGGPGRGADRHPAARPHGGHGDRRLLPACTRRRWAP